MTAALVLHKLPLANHQWKRGGRGVSAPLNVYREHLKMRRWVPVRRELFRERFCFINFVMCFVDAMVDRMGPICDTSAGYWKWYWYSLDIFSSIDRLETSG